MAFDQIDLLGLNIDTNRIRIDITAERGDGKLLGNLLCDIAGLLDNGGSLSRIADLLNRVFRNLGVA